ncbi:MAG: bifunctional precorrin-2 dehydrogenase/sirohydrochlorin ferrochelatase [Sulfurovum sp.]|nr:bifunctional precorrin-2 dehydrogenase/sirohydrochlorin ferrochelatase [Sulfurovum sp.]MCB4746008.1 bifunctional precorrin-2 dehydrogenase/sirohydrochlorin ferrochelatase [Sulfurovum sp.]MCB4749698.1 bifunctional precorrin-2 dehydrogenase/sirohydrochlorin ferrochelatase [Sulfurovum sp.]MCB4750334.1 bifunctional precorrin-2 dehydrogenase/sirohydrochlorin ferrochelatase [Sulfurovum sp.]MCB4751800.1 bifunctional precorrin-2 dehydrogenase/sirohydrochlorin ferrochelatase [Sulfurovum sp.]
MPYFPMFINIEKLKVLVVGGGVIATEKLQKLVDFTKEITIIAEELSPEVNRLICNHCLSFHQRAYRSGDIRGFDIVIIATDTAELHQQIYEESRGSGILINSVDNADYCDFIFPSYIKKEDLTIAFSTGGASPAFTKQIREYFEKIIPQSVGTFLTKMKILRTTMPKGKERMHYFETLVEAYFKKYFKS